MRQRKCPTVFYALQLGKGDYDVHCIDEGYERLGRLMTKVLERTIDESTGGN